MHLPRAGVEYATWTVQADEQLVNPPTIGFAPYGQSPAAWHPSQWSGDWTGAGPWTRQARLLLAGPDAPATDGAVIVDVSDVVSYARVVDSPEQVIRPADRIVLT